MDSEHEQRLKASLHFSVGKLCEEQEANTNIGFSKQVMATINEILWRQIKLTAQDLEAFAKHGKRTTVNLEDVKLLVRRNETLRAKVVEKMGSASNLMEETISSKAEKGKTLTKNNKKKSGPAAPTPATEVEYFIDSDNDTFM